MKTKLILAALICSFAVSAFCANQRDAMIDSQMIASKSEDKTMADGKAVVYALEGKAVLTPKGSPAERPLKVGDEIHAGDAVYTEKGTMLSISFDKKRDNAVRIPADSKAIFTSIEPTDIKLENGSIFNVVTGLAKGSTWKITTPSAVAAVRGTVFIVRYEAANGQMYAATVNVPDDGKASAIEITALTGESNAEVGEGKEIVLKEGQAPSEDAVKDLSPEAIAEVQAFFEQVSSESAEIEKTGESSSEGDAKSEEEAKSDDQSSTNSSEDNSGDELGSSPADDLDNSPSAGSDDSLPPATQEDTISELKEPETTEEDPCIANPSACPKYTSGSSGSII